MISSFQNFTAGAPFGYGAPADPLMYTGGGGVGAGHQLQSVYNAVAAAAQQGGYNVGQQPVPYHPAEYSRRPQQQQQPLPPYEPPTPPRYRSPPTTPPAPREPPNRKKPAQPPVQYTRVQGGVPGGTIISPRFLSYSNIIRGHVFRAIVSFNFSRENVCFLNLPEAGSGFLKIVVNDRGGLGIKLGPGKH